MTSHLWLAGAIFCLTALSQAQDSSSSGYKKPDVAQQFASDYYYHNHGKRNAAANTKIDPWTEQKSIKSLAELAASGSGYLLADSTDLRLNLSDPLDRNVSILLDLNGPDMRPSRNYHDYQNVSVDMSRRAWSLMHEHAVKAIESRVALSWPLWDSYMREASTSEACRRAVRSTLWGAQRLESWAIKLLLSWGSFPMSGLFEGTYGDVGAFQTCVDIRDAPRIDHAHYCSVTFRPVMPSHKDYELVLRPESERLRKLFETTSTNSSEGFKKLAMENMLTMISAGGQPLEDDQKLQEAEADWPRPRHAFTDLLEHAQYHHYVYYKWGTCWPIDCSPFDVKRLAKLVGRKNILLNGPVKCYSLNRTDYEQDYDDFGVASNGTAATTTTTTRKLVVSVWDKNDGIFVWKPHFYTAHKVAFWVVVTITAFILTMTSIDLMVNKAPQLMHKLILSLKAMPLDFEPSQVEVARRRRSAIDNHSYLKSPIPTRKHLAGASSSTRSGATFALVPSGGVVMIGGGGGNNQVAGLIRDELSDDDDDELTLGVVKQAPSLFMSIVDDCSIFSNLSSFFRVSESQMRNDILCLNGIRCITMIWVIMTHTMMYNDWGQFGRTREVEKAVKSLISQPLFNGSYIVDTFFLMSGLLSAFTAFKHCQGMRAKFNTWAYMLGRWLRLTPQILFCSLLYIILPAMSYGPHWFPIVGEFSENCRTNWWINVLHLQAFYKQDEMCNFVTWWISIDFFYHFFAIAVIWAVLLGGHKYGLATIVVTVLSQVVWQAKRHYELNLPPNLLSTIPQTGAMWTTMVLDFYWKPYTHSVAFFFGFYLGYLMALKKKLIMKMLNTRRALIGWTLSIFLLIGQSYSTYWWVIGAADCPRWFSTIFYSACSFSWTCSLCWIIIACQHGYGGFMNSLLSWKVFVVLGKCSYLVYLSHFMVLFLFYANQNLIIEPTPITMVFIILGNILLSTIWGILLCSVYEIPWLKMHRRLMKYV